LSKNGEENGNPSVMGDIGEGSLFFRPSEGLQEGCPRMQQNDPGRNIPSGENIDPSYFFTFSISSRIVSILVLGGVKKARWI
jgi:hypothetical protein